MSTSVRAIAGVLNYDPLRVLSLDYFKCALQSCTRTCALGSKWQYEACLHAVTNTRFEVVLKVVTTVSMEGILLSCILLWSKCNEKTWQMDEEGRGKFSKHVRPCFKDY